MAVGDVYQLVYTGVLSAQENNNVFHYQVGAEAGGPSSAAELNLAFTTSILPSILGVLSASYLAAALSTVNLGTPTDFAQEIFNPLQPGTRPGESVAGMVCWSFRYNRNNPGQRSGWKRFSGLSESDVFGQSPAAGVVPALDTLASNLALSLVGANASYLPSVVSRPIILGFTPPSLYNAGSADFAGVGSQVSRKRPFV